MKLPVSWLNTNNKASKQQDQAVKVGWRVEVEGHGDRKSVLCRVSRTTLPTSGADLLERSPPPLRLVGIGRGRVFSDWRRSTGSSLVSAGERLDCVSSTLMTTNRDKAGPVWLCGMRLRDRTHKQTGGRLYITQLTHPYHTCLSQAAQCKWESTWMCWNPPLQAELPIKLLAHFPRGEVRRVWICLPSCPAHSVAIRPTPGSAADSGLACLSSAVLACKAEFGKPAWSTVGMAGGTVRDPARCLMHGE